MQNAVLTGTSVRRLAVIAVIGVDNLVDVTAVRTNTVTVTLLQYREVKFMMAVPGGPGGEKN